MNFELDVHNGKLWLTHQNPNFHLKIVIDENGDFFNAEYDDSEELKFEKIDNIFDALQKPYKNFWGIT